MQTTNLSTCKISFEYYKSDHFFLSIDTDKQTPVVNRQAEQKVPTIPAPSVTYAPTNVN